ncbi:proline-rich receptor-like protein kinase PERK13 [Rosa rugosa]|uniref:proline-rich receptor-like protein kinase PERK13 n=1 Tax=Rosa rugosa TaxID=74645 RepID=UPI002B401F56|nr:proline-rich receptor-like protein kinase PERK13 [Rosa rugosa]
MPIGPLSGPPPAQSTLALVDLPDWAKEIDSVDATEEGYDAWWAEVSVNCWRQQHDEVFAAIFGELRYPYAVDVDQLARIPEDAAQAPPPAAEPGSAPLSGSHAANASQAAGQSGKQKAVMIEPEDKESSSDNDDMQTVRHRSSRHAEEGSSTVGEGTSASQAPAPTVVNHSPPPAGTVDNAQLASIPVQIIDDSSPEAENRVLLLDAPREEPSDVPVLEQIAPDSIPVPSEASPETMLAIIVYEPPIEEVPNVVGTGDDVVGAVEAEAAEPIPNVVDQELPPPAPQVAEAEELEDLPEPAPEVPEPVPEVPVAEPPTPSTLESENITTAHRTVEATEIGAINTCTLER